MVVAISRIRIVSGNADAVAEQYRQRSALVEQAEGFLGLEVLRNQDRPEEFLVYTRWVDRAAYTAYRHSPLFREAHAAIAAIPGPTRVDPATYEVLICDVVTR